MPAMKWNRLLLAVVVLALPAVSRAQGIPVRETGAQQAPQRPVEQGGSLRRQRLQGQIRQAFTRAVRTQVGLTDDQMLMLAPINQKYVRERQALAREERAARMSLRDELALAQPDQAKVAQYTAQLQAIPHKRLDLNDAEDNELAGIMTPVQLARYRALQERVQRQLNVMRAMRGKGMGPPQDSGARGSGRRGGGQP